MKFLTNKTLLITLSIFSIFSCKKDVDEMGDSELSKINLKVITENKPILPADLIFSSLNGQSLVISSDEHGEWKSTDGGNTFEKFTVPMFTELAFTTISNNGVMSIGSRNTVINSIGTEYNLNIQDKFQNLNTLEFIDLESSADFLIAIDKDIIAFAANAFDSLITYNTITNEILKTKIQLSRNFNFNISRISYYDGKVIFYDNIGFDIFNSITGQTTSYLFDPDVANHIVPSHLSYANGKIYVELHNIVYETNGNELIESDLSFPIIESNGKILTNGFIEGGSRPVASVYSIDAAGKKEYLDGEVKVLSFWNALKVGNKIFSDYNFSIYDIEEDAFYSTKMERVFSQVKIGDKIIIYGRKEFGDILVLSTIDNGNTFIEEDVSGIPGLLRVASHPDGNGYYGANILQYQESFFQQVFTTTDGLNWTLIPGTERTITIGELGRAPQFITSEGGMQYVHSSASLGNAESNLFVTSDFGVNYSNDDNSFLTEKGNFKTETNKFIFAPPLGYDTEFEITVCDGNNSNCKKFSVQTPFNSPSGRPVHLSLTGELIMTSDKMYISDPL